MAPYENKMHDLVLDFRTKAMLLTQRPVTRMTTSKDRDEKGFRKRRPKLIAAIALGTGAVLSAISLAIFRRHKR